MLRKFKGHRISRETRFVILAGALCLLYLRPSWVQESKKGIGVETWIKELDHPAVAKREAAVQHLLLSGPDSIAPLVQVIKEGSLEASLRGFLVLGSFAAITADGVNALGEKALEDLTLSKDPEVSREARHMLKAYGEVRNQRAIGALRAFGASIQISGESVYVTLTGKWKGGRDGLKHLRDLKDVKQLTISDISFTDAELDYLTGMRQLEYFNMIGGSLTSKGLARLKELVARSKNMHMAGGFGYSGKAFLGVTVQTDPKGRGCVLLTIIAESSADKAGLKAKDIVTAINKTNIKTMQNLIEAIGTKKVGEKMVVTFIREGKTLKRTLKLGTRPLGTR